MLAHSPRAVDLANYGTPKSAQASSSSPSTQTPRQQPQTVMCPDDSDFFGSDAEGELCEVEEDLGLVSSQRSQAYSEPESTLSPEHGLIYISHRLYFTYFSDTLPSPDDLNRGNGSASALFEPPSRQMRPGKSHPDYPEKYHWFNVDEDLVYLSFFEDWGPLNVGLFYRFCMHTHQLLNDPVLADRAFVFYTSSNPSRKANASLLAAMYSMIIDHIEPADAFHPFSQLEFRPFRDAGYGRADYYLTIQDILYGVHRAIEENLLDLSSFSLEEYEHYEQVQNGDWNWITPNFLAFASPNDRDYVAEIKNNGGILPVSGSRMGSKLPKVISNTVRYFKERNVQLVVRLNNPLYDKAIFEEEGIQHVDMYFDDGSNPSEEILREFIRRAHQVIQRGGSIAVHCKAGLGRTGVLIGAYLIWRYGFSASEVIGFMRIMRPGCVVGPQQHFMYQNFAQWIRWSVKDHALASARKMLEVERAQMLANGQLVEACNRSPKRQSEEGLDDRKRRGERDASLDPSPITPQARKVPRVIPATAAPAVKPVPCVGQPRKSPSPSRKRPVNILQSSTNRLCSITLQPKGSNNELSRSHSDESLSSRENMGIHKSNDTSVSCAAGFPGGSGVSSLRNSWEAIAGAVSPPCDSRVKMEDHNCTPLSPGATSRILTKTQRLNTATPELTTPIKQRDALSTVDDSTKTATDSACTATVVRPTHERSRSEVSPSAREIGAPSPSGAPRANRVPSFAASAQVKAAYGLKPTPRSSPQPQHSGGQWTVPTNADSDAFKSSSSQCSDAEALGVLSVNPPSGQTPATRPALRNFVWVPSSSNSISPAKIRAPVISAGGAVGQVVPADSAAASGNPPVAGATSSRSAKSGATNSTTSRRAESSRPRPVSAARTGTRTDTLAAAPAPSHRQTATVRKTSRSGTNASTTTANAGSSSSMKPTNTISHSTNAAMLAARANLKRARPSPDVPQSEFAPVTGIGRGVPLASGHTSGSKVGGVTASTRPPTTSSATSVRLGRNVRRRRSSLGAADIGMA